MKVELLNKDWAELSFANDSKVSIKGESEDSSSYLVKWYKRSRCNDNYDFVGDMEIAKGTWGAFPYTDIEQWKIDFFDTNEKLIASFDNNLANKPVILVAKTKPSKVGKGINFDKIKAYCTNKVNEFNCDLKVYFKDSSKFDFTDVNFEPLRMNDEIPDMFFGLEKEF
tara:strand:+ start:323 stop:826 length:504 start_codon:yes stop_codon:yes gene_type:complete